MKLKYKIRLFKAKIRLWNPPPYVAYSSDDEPLSWWFYKPMFKDHNGLYIKNWLGSLWDQLWDWT